MSDILYSEFYNNKKVLVTGCTGFKGSWLSRILTGFGANVVGYALPPDTMPNLFSMLDLANNIKYIEGDIRDFDKLKKLFNDEKPEIVFHLAAQPIVRTSYVDPRGTFDINIMGTVNVLECIRTSETVRSFLNVTTDKVYKNNEWEWGYRECEPLDGFDPYSNSKSCSELVTHSYVNSFFANSSVAVSTARAGNVIGGGDYSPDRIIPDCVRAAERNDVIIVRNPFSIRPYQHVLEPLFAYLDIAALQYKDRKYADYYNVGPDECDCVTTGVLTSLFCDKWGDGMRWKDFSDSNAPHEASFLKLDCSKIKKAIGWRPSWTIEKCIEMTCAFEKIRIAKGDVVAEVDRQIREFAEERL